MKTSSTLLLFCVGLALAITSPAFARADNLHRQPKTAAYAFNDRSGSGGLTGSATLSTSSGQHAHDGASNVFNVGSAILAGTFLLLLLQQRYRNNIVLKPKS